MVGYDPTSKEQLTGVDHTIAGASAGFITRASLQPFDVLKIRFQLQNEPITVSGLSKYHSLRHAVHTIWKEEGLTAFWKGHVPAQCLSLVFGAVQFVTFERITKASWDHLPNAVNQDYKPALYFVYGGVSGCVATLAAQPFDVLRTRLVAQAHVKVNIQAYTSMRHGFHMIRRGPEGVRGFYKGLIPALAQIAPQTGFQFAYYGLFQIIWASLFNVQSTQPGAVESLVCGSAAGFFAKLTIYPLDVLKKRIQIQGFEHGRVGLGHTQSYRNLRQCVRLIFYQEGLSGFFKGLSPSLLKAVCSSGVHFFAYEQICNILRLRHLST